MQMRQLNTEGWAKTYLIWDDESKDAGLIDPVFDFTNSYLSTIEQMGLTLTMCIATHTHADHITGCFTIAESVGCDYVMWHSTPSLGVTKFVNSDSVLSLGNHSITFHHVPGHTNDSMIVECSGHIFTGDFLFTGDGGAGRTPGLGEVRECPQERGQEQPEVGAEDQSINLRKPRGWA